MLWFWVMCVNIVILLIIGAIEKKIVGDCSPDGVFTLLSAFSLCSWMFVLLFWFGMQVYDFCVSVEKLSKSMTAIERKLEK